MIEDAELLRRYAEERSQDAFAELVRRRVNLVYSVAVRQVGGDVHLAEDVTQRVFADLARKAAELSGRAVLSGWLYRSAQFAATDVVRAERRRRAREQENHLMNEASSESAAAVDWEKLRPVLDEAMGELDDEDRDAVALRFFEERSFAEVGAALRLPEETARKRVSRALDKLHGRLTRRGVTSTTAALAIALTHQAGVAAPAGLVGAIAGSALVAVPVGAGGWLTILMTMNKLQMGIAGALALAGTAGYVVQGKTNAGLRQEIAALRVSPDAIASVRAENQRLANVAAEVEVLRRDDAELAQLSRQVAEVQQAQTEAATKLAAVRLSEQRTNEQRVKEEIARLNAQGNALVDEFKALTERSKDASFAEDIRAQMAVEAAKKLEDIKAKQREVMAYMEANRAWLPAQPAAKTAPVWRAVPANQTGPAVPPSDNLDGKVRAVPDGARMEFRPGPPPSPATP